MAELARISQTNLCSPFKHRRGKALQRVWPPTNDPKSSMSFLLAVVFGCSNFPSLPVIPPEVRCFRYVFGVQIPPHQVFGSLGF